MSKFKEQLLREEELRQKYMYSYISWLDEYFGSLKSYEDRLEDQFTDSSSKPSVDSLPQSSSNNINYNPQKGA